MATLRIGRETRPSPVMKVETAPLPHETRTVARWAYVDGHKELRYDEGGYDTAWPDLDMLKRRYPDRLWGSTRATRLGKEAPIYFFPAEKFSKEGGPPLHALETDEPLDGTQWATQLELFVEPHLAKPAVILCPDNRENSMYLKYTWLVVIDDPVFEKCTDIEEVGEIYLDAAAEAKVSPKWATFHVRKNNKGAAIGTRFHLWFSRVQDARKCEHFLNEVAEDKRVIKGKGAMIAKVRPLRVFVCTTIRAMEAAMSLDEERDINSVTEFNPMPAADEDVLMLGWQGPSSEWPREERARWYNIMLEIAGKIVGVQFAENYDDFRGGHLLGTNVIYNAGTNTFITVGGPGEKCPACGGGIHMGIIHTLTCPLHPATQLMFQVLKEQKLEHIAQRIYYVPSLCTKQAATFEDETELADTPIVNGMLQMLLEPRFGAAYRATPEGRAYYRFMRDVFAIAHVGPWAQFKERLRTSLQRSRVLRESRERLETPVDLLPLKVGWIPRGTRSEAATPVLTEEMITKVPTTINPDLRNAVISALQEGFAHEYIEDVDYTNTGLLITKSYGVWFAIGIGPGYAAASKHAVAAQAAAQYYGLLVEMAANDESGLIAMATLNLGCNDKLALAHLEEAVAEAREGSKHAEVAHADKVCDHLFNAMEAAK